MLLGGDPVVANVKYEKGNYIYKTPCIIMSNGKCIPNIPVFDVRIHHYILKPLTNFDRGLFCKRIHPFTFIDVWKDLGVWVNE